MSNENKWLGMISVYQKKNRTKNLIFTCPICETGFIFPLSAAECCRDEKIKNGVGSLLGAEK